MGLAGLFRPGRRAAAPRAGRAAPGRWRGQTLEARRLLALDFAWGATIGSTGTDDALATAFDPAGNLYVAGRFSQTAQFAPGVELASAGATDAFLARYSPAGELEWVRGFGGAQADAAFSVAATADRVYVAGSFRDAVDFHPGPGQAIRTSQGSSDAFLAVFDAAGGLVNVATWGGPGVDQAIAVAVGDGAVWVVGEFSQTVNLAPLGLSQQLVSQGLRDGFVARFSLGGALESAFAIGGGGLDQVSSVAAGQGRVAIAGRFQQQVDFDPGAGQRLLTASGLSFDAFVAEYDTAGALRWAHRLGGNDTDLAFDIALAADRSVYVVGQFFDTVDFDPGPSAAVRSAGESGGGFLVKFADSGAFQWVAEIGGAGGASLASVAIAPDGQIFAAGAFAGVVDVEPGPGQTLLTSAGSSDIVLLQLDPLGRLVDAQRIGGAFDDNPLAIAFSSSGELALAGYFQGSLTLGEGNDTVTMASRGGADGLVAVFAASAELLAPAVLGRHVFYNHSAWDDFTSGADAADDHALASDKFPLRPGGNATAENLTNYARGLNGLFIDVASAPDIAALGAEHFRFRLGVGDDLETWSLAPPPSSVVVRPGAGVGQSDRITLIWPDGALRNTWLEVTVLAGGPLGLLFDDVFYFGNAVGQTRGDEPHVLVNAADYVAVRDNPRGVGDPAAVDDPHDLNRDRLVDAADLAIVAAAATGFREALPMLRLAPELPPPPDDDPPPDEDPPDDDDPFGEGEAAAFDAALAAWLADEATARRARVGYFGLTE